MSRILIEMRNLIDAFSAKAMSVEKQSFLEPRSHFVYGMVLFVIVVEGLLIAFAGFRLANAGFQLSLLWTAWMLFSAMLARRYGFPRLANGIEVLFLPVLTGALIAAATFMTTAVSGPFTDEMLSAADRAMGFDWMALLRLYEQYPDMFVYSKQVYNSLFLQLAVVPLGLVAFGHSNRAWEFLTAWVIAGFATAAIHPLFPAMGPYVQYGEMARQMPGYIPSFHGNYLWDVGAKIEAIRSGELREMSAAMRGLVSVPSFHAAAAVMLGWAALAFRWAWLPFICLNTLMWLSSIVSGSHYLIDLIAGSVVGVFSLIAARAIVARGARTGKVRKIPAAG